MNKAISENRNSIYFLKVCTTIMILVHHYYSPIRHIGWYIGVEFFFIVSGYLLADKMDMSEEVVKPMWHRFQRLYPEYIEAIVLLLFAEILDNRLLLSDVPQKLLGHVPELFMLHMIGAPFYSGLGFLNNVAWYVSAMFIATIIFLFVNKLLHKVKFWKWFIGIYVIIFYTYNCLMKDIGVEFWGGIRFQSDAIFRALAAMGIGVLIHELSKKENIVLMVKEHSLLLNVIAGGSYIGIWAFTFFYPNTKYDVLATLGFAVVVFVAFHAKTYPLFDNAVIRYLNKVSYVVYLNQLLWLIWFQLHVPYENFCKIEYMVAYVVLSVVTGIIVYNINVLIKKVFIKLKAR